MFSYSEVAGVRVARVHAKAWRQTCTAVLTSLAVLALVVVGIAAPAQAIAQPSTLTLVNVVENGATSSTVTTADFTLTATGASLIEGATGDPAVTDAIVEPGSYELSESGPDGYTVGDWSCTGADVVGGVIEVPEATDVLCSVTHTADPAVPDVLPIDPSDPSDPVAVDAPFVDLAITKTSDPAVSEPFEDVAYVISVRNVGTANVPSGDTVTVTDELPPTAYYDLLPAECSEAGGVVTCDLDPSDLAAGADAVDLELIIFFGPETTPGEQQNLAVVTTATDPAGGKLCPTQAAPSGVTTPLNNVACALTTINVDYALEIDKWAFENDEDDVTDGVVRFGDSLVYIVEVYNSGNGTLTDVTVTDVVPAGLIVDEDEIGCLDDGRCDVSYDPATRTITWQLGPLDPDEGVQMAFIVELPVKPSLEPGDSATFSATNQAQAWAAEIEAVRSNDVTVEATATAPVAEEGVKAPELPDTGADTAPLAMGAGGLAVAGLILLGVARRRRD